MENNLELLLLLCFYMLLQAECQHRCVERLLDNRLERLRIGQYGRVISVKSGQCGRDGLTGLLEQEKSTYLVTIQRALPVILRNFLDLLRVVPMQSRHHLIGSSGYQGYQDYQVV